jgi:hypothetical protein
LLAFLLAASIAALYYLTRLQTANLKATCIEKAAIVGADMTPYLFTTNHTVPIRTATDFR